MLLDVSRQIASMDSLDEVLAMLVRLSVEQTDSERGSLFLNDPTTGELYSRIALGGINREIRILNNTGVAGHVYTGGAGLIVPDAYADERFDRTTDSQTGFHTRNILCAPIRTARGDVIGVVQTLNRREGDFTEVDMHLLEAITSQAAITLQSRQHVENLQRSHEQDLEFLGVVSDVVSELELGPLLQKIMSEARRLLKADRATLFLNDEKTNELWSEAGTGLKKTEIRFPNDRGIAGAVFTSGNSINIPYAYADLRFNPSFDKHTGYFTRSILCVPVVNKTGVAIGVVQALNKSGGVFGTEDETRLRAFSARISLALENSRLFRDIQNIKNYNESMLESMSNGVITLDDKGCIVTCNRAGHRILGTASEAIIGKTASEFFGNGNSWVMERIQRLQETSQPQTAVDARLECGTESPSVNLTVLPLIDADSQSLGSMLVLEDISSEKRMRSTMTRYMDPELADQLMTGSSDIGRGRSIIVTVLFADIRRFTSLTERMGPEATVQLLNDYFEVMVECVQNEGGMLDKFIGDALMAGFGTLVHHEDDEDRAVRAAIDMLVKLGQFNAQRIAAGQERIEIGIGLNTDRVIAGPIGSTRRQDYTMIGDGVNLAARLESACKQYQAGILASENTIRRLRGTYRMRDVDRVILAGKSEPITVYEILDHHTPESFPQIDGVLENHQKAMLQYRRGDWDRALKLFEASVRLNPHDRLSAMYCERCQQLRESPPPEDWNGVWQLSHK